MRENSGNPRSEKRTAAPFFSQTAMGDFESCKLASALHEFPTSGKTTRYITPSIHPGNHRPHTSAAIAPEMSQLFTPI